MNTLILSASRYRRRSITSMLLNPFIEGLREAGIGYTSFNTFDLNIRPCRGDLSCWFKTSGRCIQNISSETQSTISREILSKHDYMELINTRADTLLKP